MKTRAPLLPACPPPAPPDPPPDPPPPPTVVVERHDENGHLVESAEMQGGVLNGTTVFYGPDGQETGRAEFKNGVLDGTVTMCDEQGRVTWCAAYKSGAPHGDMSTWQEGVLAERVPYVEGRRQGTAFAWHPDGTTASALPYVADRLEGCAVWYAPGGRETRSAEYLGGALHGVTLDFYTTTEAEAVRTRSEYRQGVLHGTVTQYATDGRALMRTWFCQGQPLWGIACDWDTSAVDSAPVEPVQDETDPPADPAAEEPAQPSVPPASDPPAGEVPAETGEQWTTGDPVAVAADPPADPPAGTPAGTGGDAEATEANPPVDPQPAGSADTVDPAAETPNPPSDRADVADNAGPAAETPNPPSDPPAVDPAATGEAAMDAGQPPPQSAGVLTLGESIAIDAVAEDANPSSDRHPVPELTAGAAITEDAGQPISIAAGTRTADDADPFVGARPYAEVTPDDAEDAAPPGTQSADPQPAPESASTGPVAEDADQPVAESVDPQPASEPIASDAVAEDADRSAGQIVGARPFREVTADDEAADDPDPPAGPFVGARPFSEVTADDDVPDEANPPAAASADPRLAVNAAADVNQPAARSADSPPASEWTQTQAAVEYGSTGQVTGETGSEPVESGAVGEDALVPHPEYKPPFMPWWPRRDPQFAWLYEPTEESQGGQEAAPSTGTAATLAPPSPPGMISGPKHLIPEAAPPVVGPLSIAPAAAPAPEPGATAPEAGEEPAADTAPEQKPSLLSRVFGWTGGG